MDDEQRKLVYQLYTKGKENLSGFDKIIIEANPEIKGELEKLYNVDEELYEECDKRIEKALGKERESKKREGERHYKIFPLLAVPASAAAGVFIILQLVFFLNTPSVALGSKVSLFITNHADPGHFIESGSSFRSTDSLQLAFQLPVNAEDIRQGVIFSASDTGENLIFYRYDSHRDRLNQRERIVVAEKLNLAGKSDYLYFIAYFSASPFSEKELVDTITKLIVSEKKEAAGILLKKYKAEIINIIYLIRTND
ncbi:MAG: hypothetical protein JXJ04_14500 [Spirochaetales bacterium]|nr:hypothetical protein [Spirochaetales bacterium]